ncbi:hypothetical protein ES708_09910 [subsurface metagenome]
MTRRKFIQKLIKFGAAVIAGTCWLAKKAVPAPASPDARRGGGPRKFVWAAGLKKYPGSLKPLSDIRKQGKWSG